MLFAALRHHACRHADAFDIDLLLIAAIMPYGADCCHDA